MNAKYLSNWKDRIKNALTVAFLALEKMRNRAPYPYFLKSFTFRAELLRHILLIKLLRQLTKCFKLFEEKQNKQIHAYLKKEILIFQKIRPSIHSVTIAPILFSINYSEA
ncbi:hypothetical protein [Acinetobacter sp.]|uniref:hypothetical protein n=1 Tax=Acinetobacter sp. TaxID=472 RepID=UPI0035AEBCA9